MFNIFINDLDDITECTITKFSSDTKLERVNESPKGHAVFQMHINRLEEWEDRNIINFSKGKCNVLHLGRNNYRHQYLLEATQLERNLIGPVSKSNKGP